MGIFSILWQLLFLFFSFLNMFIIFKYSFDKYLAKSKGKIHVPSIIKIAEVVTFVSMFVQYFFLEGNNSFELFPLSTIKANPSIFLVFLGSSLLLVAIDFSVNVDYSAIYKKLNTFIGLGLLLGPAMVIIINFKWLLSKNLLRDLPFLPTDHKLFWIYVIYRNIILPGVYLLLFFQFLIISKKISSGAGDFDKKINKMCKLENILLFFYFIFIFSMVWFNLINFGSHYEDVNSFLINLIFNTYYFILVYGGISSYISTTGDKPKIFGNLFKRVFIFYFLSPFILLVIFIGRYVLQELKIAIIPVIITAILIATITAIINILINRFFKI